MNDDSDFDPDGDELLVIDPRSPGERWAESGRAGLGRMQASFRGQRLAVVALCWMVGIATLLGAQVWQALHLGSRFGLDMQNATWFKMMFLSQTGSISSPSEYWPASAS